MLQAPHVQVSVKPHPQTSRLFQYDLQNHDARAPTGDGSTNTAENSGFSGQLVIYDDLPTVNERRELRTRRGYV